MKVIGETDRHLDCNMLHFNQEHIQKHVEPHGREVGFLHCLSLPKRITSGVTLSYKRYKSDLRESIHL